MFITTFQATRWDNYLHIFDPRIHWFSLINSLVIATFLCIMVGMILWRNVSRDVSIIDAFNFKFLTGTPCADFEV